jgi:3-oxoacyl-[acyl-carrier protein] reductase
MDLGIEGRPALVTAASKGLGFACAKALAREGAAIAICGRSGESLEAAAEALRAEGGEVVAIKADVTDAGEIRRTVAETVERLGGLQILVGNVGGPPVGPSMDVSDDELDLAIHNNLLSQIRLMRAAIPHMQNVGWGRICLITATGVREPLPGHGLSATSRTGLWGWAKTASHELATAGITINSVLPGFHTTARNLESGHSMEEVARVAPHMAGRAGDPDDLGRLVAFLCSEPARWVTGSAINADGGVTLSLL